MHQSLLPPFSTAAYISVGTLILAVLLLSKLSSKPPSRSKKERIAKESFRVRKSNLLAVSGRGPDKRRFKYKQQWRFNDKRCVDDDDAVENDSWFFRIIRLFHQYFIDAFARLFCRDYMKPTSHNNESTKKPFTSRLPPKISLEDYYNNVQVVGLDCEMVGGGKGGMNSMLARCSVVTLDCIPIHQADDKILLGDTKKINSINQNLVVLYDKYVIPKGRITDYRTQWSGITKETYHNSSTHDVPVVTFYQCQKEITELFSSIDGRSVVVVGHALENDFDALEIKHPDAFTRDTSLYRPYMRQVRRRLFPRKLSVLTSEELGIEIQQEPQLVIEQTEVNDDTPSEYAASVGHSSVEDAAAALRLYWHKCQDWERSLRYPLLVPCGASSDSCTVKWPPIKTFYLDSCNLPVGLRGVDFKQLLANTGNDDREDVTASKAIRLVSRQTSRDNKSLITTTDWMPHFRSILLPGSCPRIENVVIMFDGAKFKDITKNRRKAKINYQTRRFPLESPKDHGTIAIEITNDGDSADDILYHQCKKVSSTDEPPLGRFISLQQANDLLSKKFNQDNDQMNSYIVIRRKAGGSKSHRRLFDKLHLRRPDEGALCLSGLTAALQKDSWRIIRELQRERGVERVIECELRRRDEIVHVVVTDDVFLTERLVNLGTVLVLSYRQMGHMF
ncbi:hypothetical protein ACHAXN_011956 [Cyclotella atomus]